MGRASSRSRSCLRERAASASRWRSRLVAAGLLASLLIGGVPLAHAADADPDAEVSSARPLPPRPPVGPEAIVQSLGGGWTLAAAAAIEERVVGTQVSAMDISRPLPTDGGRLEPSLRFENRLRVGGHTALRSEGGFLREVRVDVGADLLSGPLTDAVEDARLAFDPEQPHSGGAIGARGQFVRKASLQVTTTAGRVFGGRMVNSWGLGLLAQGADDDPMQFGFRRQGHFVNRVGVSVLPASWFVGDRAQRDLPIVAGFAYDWLVHDDRVDVRDGDRGNNMIATLGWFGEAVQAGFFGVRRTQTNALGLSTEAWVADVYARATIRAGDWTVGLATEWVYINGESEVAPSLANPDGHRVEQVGGAVRLDVERGWFVARLEGGYASGDSRPYDDTLRNFTFARDYRVGVALFPEYLRRHTAVAAHNAQDPRFTGQAPVGFDELPTGGAVTSALYLHPVFGVKPNENLTVLFGAVLARSPVDLADAYQTGLAGGAPTGPYGKRRGRNLGVELDAGVRYLQPLGAGLALEGRFDAGLLFPGDAFDDADGGAAAPFGVAIGQVMLRGSW